MIRTAPFHEFVLLGYFCLRLDFWTNSILEGILKKLSQLKHQYKYASLFPSTSIAFFLILS